MMARIIVIDDDESVRKAIRRVLEPLGHEVLEADDGAVGLTLVATKGADLVITDIFMPGQDGIVTVRQIRKEYPAVRIIAISGGDTTGRMDSRCCWGPPAVSGSPLSATSWCRPCEACSMRGRRSEERHDLSSTARTFRASASGVNGFSRNAAPGSISPWWTTAWSVYPEM